MTITPAQFGKALAKQQAFTDAEWLKRCEELAVEQRVLFLELATFFRDGVPEKLARRFIDYLSALQFAAKEISTQVSAPVELPEFQAATKRMMQFLYALETDDRAHFDRMTKVWFEAVVQKTDAVVWTGCFDILRDPEIMSHALHPQIGCTLASIADIYANRLSMHNPSK